MKPIAIHLAEKLEDLPSTGDWLLINNAAAELRRLQADVERLSTTAAQPAIPDAIHHTDLSEHPRYISGWNDYRAAMMEMMK